MEAAEALAEMIAGAGKLAREEALEGAGDFDADGKDDLLVRQNSTGLAGAYASADMSQWSTVTTDYLLA